MEYFAAIEAIPKNRNAPISMNFSALMATLNQYQPWDAVEAAHHAAIQELLATHPTPFDRHAYKPGHITGSTWILAEDTGNVALIYHRRLDCWLQPGGHAEPGETDGKSTALREAREELGLELNSAQARLFDLDVHRIPETTTQPSHFHFDIRYLCPTKQQTLISGSDAANARWFSIAELAAIDLDASIRRMIEKGMKGYSRD